MSNRRGHHVCPDGFGEPQPQSLARLAPRRHDAPALRHLRHQPCHIRRLHDFEVGIGGISLQPPHALGGVEEGKALALSEVDDAPTVKRLCPSLLHLEVTTVSKEDDAHDAPKIVYPVRVEEVHAPPYARRRETTQKEYAGISGEEGFERMVFDFHDNEQVDFR